MTFGCQNHFRFTYSCRQGRHDHKYNYRKLWHNQGIILWYWTILSTNLAAVVCVCVSVCVQNLTNFCPDALISTPNAPKKFPHSNIPIRYIWTALCVPLSFICYEKQQFIWKSSRFATCRNRCNVHGPSYCPRARQHTLAMTC